MFEAVWQLPTPSGSQNNVFPWFDDTLVIVGPVFWQTLTLIVFVLEAGIRRVAFWASRACAKYARLPPAVTPLAAASSEACHVPLAADPAIRAMRLSVNVPAPGFRQNRDTPATPPVSA